MDTKKLNKGSSIANALKIDDSSMADFLIDIIKFKLRQYVLYKPIDGKNRREVIRQRVKEFFSLPESTTYLNIVRRSSYYEGGMYYKLVAELL